MNSLSDIQKELTLFIKNNLITEDTVLSVTTPLEDLCLDSLSIIEIVLFIERKYDLILPDRSLTKDTVYSVESFSKCVWEHLSINNPK